MAQGMNMGIFTLLFVVLGVLLGIASFFFYIIRRASRLAAAGLSPVDLPGTATRDAASNPAAAPTSNTRPGTLASFTQ
jgi:hypothetical protein